MEVVNPALRTPKATQPQKVKKSSKLEESEPPPESEFMDAKLQRIIAKLKRKADAVDEDSAPFFPAAQYKPKKATQEKTKMRLPRKARQRRPQRIPPRLSLRVRVSRRIRR